MKKLLFLYLCLIASSTKIFASGQPSPRSIETETIKQNLAVLRQVAILAYRDVLNQHPEFSGQTRELTLQQELRRLEQKDNETLALHIAQHSLQPNSGFQEHKEEHKQEERE